MPRRPLHRDRRGLHNKTLRVLRADGDLEAPRMLCDRREQLTRLRVQTVNRLQRCHERIG